MSLKAQIEAVIYAAEEPVTLSQIISLLSDSTQSSLPGLEVAPPSSDAAPDAPHTPPSTKPEKSADRDALRKQVAAAIEELSADYAREDHAIEIRSVAGGYRMATKPEHHDLVRNFARSLKPALRLSLPALETLAVIAYRQPVTGPEISEIRGVDSSAVLGGLLARKLITTAGRKQVVGRPILYKTTRDFLMRFGLKDVSELPSLEEFEKMAAEVTSIEDLGPDGSSQPDSLTAAPEQSAP
jgi:segregation and condensation protein B